MASNPYVNKVEYDGQTLMDLTGDTVTANDVRSGVTFHDRSGAAQQGGLIISSVYNGLDSSSTTDALSANMGRELNAKFEKNSYTAFTVLYNRGTILNGGYVRIGKKAFISVVFQASFTASNVPGILGTSDFTSDIPITPLTCLDITDFSTDSVQVVPCLFYAQGNNRIMLQSAVSGHTYSISGVVNIQ